METTPAARITKSHAICYAIMRLAQESGCPSRVETMAYVHRLEGRATPFKPGSNVCYFIPSASTSPYGPGASASSVLVKGLVVQAGKRGRTMTYAVTPAGMAMAQAFVASRAIPSPR